MRSGRLQSQVLFLKDPHLDLFTDELTGSELQYWGSSSNSARDAQGKNELSGFRTKDGWTAFSDREELVEAIVFFVEPSPLLACRHRWLLYLSFHQPR